MTTSYHIALLTALLATALAGCNSSSGGGGTADRELTLMADTGSLIIAASKVNPREYLYLSADRGDTWTLVDFSDEDQFQWSHLSGSDGVFYGQDGNRRILWTSTDGTTWQREISPHIVVDVANDNGAQLVVGDVNHIVRREAN